MNCSKCGNFEKAGVKNCSKCNNEMPICSDHFSSPIPSTTTNSNPDDLELDPDIDRSSSPLPITTTSNDEASSSGDKIIALAVTVRVISTLLTIITAGACLFGVRSYGLTYALAGSFGILAIGLFYSWAASILIRGFGELVNNSEKIAKKH